MEGHYQPIPVEALADGRVRGYSRVLDLYLSWEQGSLEFYDPRTGASIASMDSLKEDLRQAEEEIQRAQARIRELEEQLGQSSP